MPWKIEHDRLLFVDPGQPAPADRLFRAERMTLRIISLETTEAVGGVAACNDDNLLLELKLDTRARSAQSLAPGLKRLLDEVGWRPRDVELVGVTIGPGSFTGLRVGVVSAKTFAHAVGAEILGLDTLEVVAAGLPPEVDGVSVAVDAQRGQVVAGSFERREDGHFAVAETGRLLDVDTWLGDLPSGTWVSGPVLRKVCDRLPDGVRAVEPQYWAPSAAQVAMLAARQYRTGKRHDVWKLTPRYSRPSAAEEKWGKKAGR